MRPAWCFCSRSSRTVVRWLRCICFSLHIYTPVNVIYHSKIMQPRYPTLCSFHSRPNRLVVSFVGTHKSFVLNCFHVAENGWPKNEEQTVFCFAELVWLHSLSVGSCSVACSWEHSKINTLSYGKSWKYHTIPACYIQKNS